MKNSKIYKTLEELIRIQSDTNSIMEKDIEAYILNCIENMPYFQTHKTYGKNLIENDDFGRGIVWALIKGKEDQTIILLNHHDAVDIEVYGSLKNLAFEPEDLKKSLKQLKLDPDTEKDLQDDNWMFGRGTADMKAGLAIHLQLLENYSQKETFNGNILFLSVADEESLSKGMRYAVKLLQELRQEHDLTYNLLINSEPHERESNEFTVYDSSVGKTMAAVYVQGIKSHIGKIYDGLNPTLILSNIVQKTELNPIFSDQALGDYSPPPSWSYVRDFKAFYDASIPEAAGGYLSFLTLNSTPKDILDRLKTICKVALEETIQHKIVTYEEIFSRKFDKTVYLPQVKFYEELLADAVKINETLTAMTLSSTRESIKKELKNNQITIPESNFIIIRALLEIVSYNEPTVVIALSPPFYPHISTEIEHPDIMKNVKLALLDHNIDFQHYFMGISDLSYTGLQNANKVAPYVAPNMPLWGEDIYNIDFTNLKTLSIPSIILGPWGKDLHKMTERVYVPDLVEYTQLLISELIDSIV